MLAKNVGISQHSSKFELNLVHFFLLSFTAYRVSFLVVLVLFTILGNQSTKEIWMYANACGRIGPIGLEVAQPSQNASGSDVVAYGVEQCQCPERYSGLSCQVWWSFSSFLIGREFENVIKSSPVFNILELLLILCLFFFFHYSWLFPFLHLSQKGFPPHL